MQLSTSALSFKPLLPVFQIPFPKCTESNAGFYPFKQLWEETHPINQFINVRLLCLEEMICVKRTSCVPLKFKYNCLLWGVHFTWLKRLIKSLSYTPSLGTIWSLFLFLWSSSSSSSSHRHYHHHHHHQHHQTILIITVIIASPLATFTAIDQIQGQGIFIDHLV